MKALIQRVSHAKVEVEKKCVGSINQGLLVFLGICHTDGEKETLWLANKILSLRIFTDLQGKMNHSVQDLKGEILVISQFTLYASCLKGRRPDFMNAAAPDLAKSLYHSFIETLSTLYSPVQEGLFGAKMEVSLCNDGPVTLMIETP